VARKNRWARNVEMPLEWRGQIHTAMEEADAPDSEAAWIRSAIREKLRRAQLATDIRELEERQAKTLTDIAAAVHRSDSSLQTLITYMSNSVKMILTLLPDIGDPVQARERGRKLHDAVLKKTSAEMAAVNGNGNTPHDTPAN
jgi:hypothetical protein